MAIIVTINGLQPVAHERTLDAMRAVEKAIKHGISPHNINVKDNAGQEYDINVSVAFSEKEPD